MNMKMRKGQLIILAALLTATLSISAVAYVYYSLNIPMTFRVQTSYGLQVWNEDKTQIIGSVAWGDFSLSQMKVANFTLKNTGNRVALVNLDLPSLSGWIIQTTFVNGTAIVKDGFSNVFSVTLREYSADSTISYSGNLTFSIVG